MECDVADDFPLTRDPSDLITASRRAAADCLRVTLSDSVPTPALTTLFLAAWSLGPLWTGLPLGLAAWVLSIMLAWRVLLDKGSLLDSGFVPRGSQISGMAIGMAIVVGRLGGTDITAPEQALVAPAAAALIMISAGHWSHGKARRLLRQPAPRHIDADPQYDEVLSSPYRLRIYAFLEPLSAVDSLVLGNALNLTESVLDHHLKVLGDAGYAKVLTLPDRQRTQTIFVPTKAGRRAYQRHVAELHRRYAYRPLPDPPRLIGDSVA